MRARVFWLSLFMVASGCASVQPVPVKNFDDPKGIPYYDGSFYLLVFPDGAGNLQWKLEYIADPQKKMVYRTHQFLSSVEADLTFSNGLMTSSTTATDSTVVPKAVISAVEKVLLAGIANDTEPTHSQEIPAPTILKLIINGDSFEFVGEQNLQTVKATITTPAKEGAK